MRLDLVPRSAAPGGELQRSQRDPASLGFDDRSWAALENPHDAKSRFGLSVIGLAPVRMQSTRAPHQILQRLARLDLR